jgi:hypothetical protein
VTLPIGWLLIVLITILDLDVNRPIDVAGDLKSQFLCFLYDARTVRNQNASEFRAL